MILHIRGKIPISIHPTFWLLALAIGWMSSSTVLGIAVWVVIVTLSVLVHEWGHALTALYYGQAARIDLVGLGGLTHRIGKKLSFWQEFVVVLSGPLAGFVLSLVGYVIMKRGPFVQGDLFYQIALILFIANLFWNCMNLMPVYPLDGGKLLSISLEKLFGLKGLKAALLLSTAFGTFLSISFFIYDYPTLGMLFTLFTFDSFRIWRETLPLAAADRCSESQLQLRAAERLMQQKQLHEAEILLQQLREKNKKGAIYLSATEMLGEMYVQQGKYNTALKLLLPNKKKLSPTGLYYLQQAHYCLSEWDETIETGITLYRIAPRWETAFLTALATANKGKEKECLGWLRCAVKGGLPNPSHALQKEEFSFLCNNSEFQKLSKQTSVEHC